MTSPNLYWVRPAEITSSAGECLLQLGQPDRAVVLVDEGIALSSTLNVDRIRSLTRLMKPHSRIPAVQDFLERAKGLVKE